MAYPLSSPPSSICNDRRLLCNSLSPPQRPQFTSLQPEFRPKTFNFHLVHQRKPSHVSLQEQNQTANLQDAHSPDEKPNYSTKSSLWVNPNSPRASKLVQGSYDSRYANLVKIADSLNVCNHSEAAVASILDTLGPNILEQEATVVLNHMSNSETAPLVLNYFLRRYKFTKEVILYNVTLKVFKKNKDLDRAEKLFDEMVEKGIKPDNFTFSTIIGCAKICSSPLKSVEWFEKMPSFGCRPDDITLSVMIDAYGRTGNVDKALSLYDRARAEKWRPDAGTYATLIKIYGASGNFDGCLNVYEEMKALRCKPSVGLYNTLLDAMGRAKRPWQVKNIYKEMISNGFRPTWGTYAALIHAYSRARYTEDAFIVYEEMKEKGLELNVFLYNSLLAMCADVGLTDRALEIFEDLKCAQSCKPDSWTYASLIGAYSCTGQVAEAEATLRQMMDEGFEPTIFVLTSLTRCYGNAGKVDDVVRTFDWLLELGITPDGRFSSCLLNVMTVAPTEELGKLATRVEKADARLGHMVSLLMDVKNVDRDNFKIEATELFESVDVDVRKAYCNCLIDLSVKLNQMDRACELLHVGRTLHIYHDIQSRTPSQWFLQLRSLSAGAALTALHIWIDDLTKASQNGEELPSVFVINTGQGKNRTSDKNLVNVVELRLKELNAPFHEAPDKAGWFLTTKVAAVSWLESLWSQEAVTADATS